MDVKQAHSYVGVSDVKQVHVLEALTTTYPEIQRLDWKSTTFEAFIGDEDEDEIFGLLEAIKFIPDGYVVDPKERELYFFEVEIHSPMSGEKLRTYGKMAIDLAYYDINFVVMTINKYGHIQAVDLLPYYADWLQRDAT